MQIDDYPSNSHKDRSTKEKELEPVVTSGAKIHKKNGANRLMDALISEDAPSVGSYIFHEILVPTIQRTIVDIISNGAAMIFGETRYRRSDSSYHPYHSYYDDRRRDRERDRDYPVNRVGQSFDEITVRSRGEAQRILDSLEDNIREYDFVTVYDLYKLAGLSAPYTYNKYGWTDIRGARIISMRNDEYLIRLPKAVPVD